MTEPAWPAPPRVPDEAKQLESMRVLARGVAHDLNNLLTSVFGLLELSLHAGVSSAERQAYVETALGSLEAARGLTRELTAMVSPKRAASAPYAVGRAITDSTRFTFSGSRVLARLSLPDDLWAGAGDCSRIRRVLDNLLLNARQAMPSGGHVSIAARNVELEAGNGEGLGAGRYVEIRIADDGPGVPASVLKRLFAAQVSTKKGGSGIGLATCRALLEEDGGSIRLDSTVGCGATFTLHLRATTAPVPEPRRHQRRALAGQQVLIVDDEPRVRNLFQTALEQQGYRVSAASGRSEAVELLLGTRATGRDLPVAIVDITLDGGLGGLELLRELRRLEPGLRAVASTGLATPTRELLAAGFDAVLRKPFPLVELFATVAALGEDTTRPNLDLP